MRGVLPGSHSAPAARTIDGTIYVGLFKGVFVYEPASCAWTTHTLGEELLFVRDLAFSAGGDLLAVTSSGASPTVFFNS